MWLTFVMAARLGERGAGAVAALLVAVSPTFLYQLVQPMSDIPVAAAWLGALVLAPVAGVSGAVGAGAAAGLAVLIRPNLLPLALLVWIACVGSRAAGGRPRRFATAMLATLPALLVLGFVQSVRFGSPLASGYGPAGDLFALANILPNLDRYYFGTSEWSYTRFLLPALSLMWLLSALPATLLLRRARPAIRIALSAVVVLPLGWWCLRAAESRDVFRLRDLESRYVHAAEHVRRTWPARAVVVSMQHSGSIWFHTPHPVLRWDEVHPQSIGAIARRLRTDGYALVIVADAEEGSLMRDRFGADGMSRLAPLHSSVFGKTVVYAAAEPVSSPLR